MRGPQLAILLGCALALAACAVAPNGTPATAPAASPSPSPADSAAGSGPTTASSAAPAPASVDVSLPPSASPSPEPAATPGPATITGVAGASTAACGTPVHVTRAGPPAEPVPLTDVRIASHRGAQRIVFTFEGDIIPAVDVEPASPPFVRDGSGLPVDVPGVTHLRIHFPSATGMATYAGSGAFAGSDPPLTSLVRTGDYEGVLSWVAGLTGPTCWHVTVLGSPVRLVIDLARYVPAS
jgi:hypothetical protein